MIQIKSNIYLKNSETRIYNIYQDYIHTNII